MYNQIMSKFKELITTQRGGQSRLATHLNVSRQVVQHWYKKDSVPIKYIERTAKFLRVDVSDLLP